VCRVRRGSKGEGRAAAGQAVPYRQRARQQSARGTAGTCRCLRRRRPWSCAAGALGTSGCATVPCQALRAVPTLAGAGHATERTAVLRLCFGAYACAAQRGRCALPMSTESAASVLNHPRRSVLQDIPAPGVQAPHRACLGGRPCDSHTPRRALIIPASHNTAIRCGTCSYGHLCIEDRLGSRETHKPLGALTLLGAPSRLAVGCPGLALALAQQALAVRHGRRRRAAGAHAAERPGAQVDFRGRQGRRGQDHVLQQVRPAGALGVL